MLAFLAKAEAFLKGADGDIVKAAKFIAGTGLNDLEKVEGEGSVIEGIAGLAGPEAAKVATVGVELVDWAIKSIEGAEAADAAGGVNVTLDAALLAEIKSIAGIVKPAPATT